MNPQISLALWRCFLGVTLMLAPFKLSGAHTVQADVESLWSSDILLTHASLEYAHKRQKVDWKLSLAHSTIDLDYEPVSFDFLGAERSLDEDRDAFQSSVRYAPLTHLTLLASAGLYEGFTTYRSAWLNEYYRQQFAPLPGYKTAHPSGQNVSAGFRWEYVPSSSFLQFDASYLHDEIAPGYDIDFDGLQRGRSHLETTVFGLQFENVLTRRARLLNELRLVNTTGRKIRFAYQASLNLAIAERFVLRTSAGYTREDPQFEAYYAGSTFEFEITPACLVSLGARYYKDTGEIENSLLISNAAPGVETYQIAFGFRWLWESASLKLTVGPYLMRYEDPQFATLVFRNLYEDRNWGIAQLAYSHSF